MRANVRLHFLQHLTVVSTLRVKPEDCGVAGGAGAGHGQLDPVLDRGVLGLAHAPDVTDSHRVVEDFFPGRCVDHLDRARLCDLEGLVVRPVLLGLLRHEPHVGNVAHGGRVELAVGLAEVHGGGVDAGVPVGSR